MPGRRNCSISRRGPGVRPPLWPPSDPAPDRSGARWVFALSVSRSGAGSPESSQATNLATWPPSDLAPDRSGARAAAGHLAPARDAAAVSAPGHVRVKVAVCKLNCWRVLRHHSNPHKARPGETDSCPRETDSRAGPNGLSNHEKERSSKRDEPARGHETRVQHLPRGLSRRFTRTCATDLASAAVSSSRAGSRELAPSPAPANP